MVRLLLWQPFSGPLLLLVVAVAKRSLRLVAAAFENQHVENASSDHVLEEEEPDLEEEGEPRQAQVRHDVQENRRRWVELELAEDSHFRPLVPGKAAWQWFAVPLSKWMRWQGEIGAFERRSLPFLLQQLPKVHCCCCNRRESRKNGNGGVVVSNVYHGETKQQQQQEATATFHLHFIEIQQLIDNFVPISIIGLKGSQNDIIMIW